MLDHFKIMETGEGNEVTAVSIISTPDIAEDLPSTGSEAEVESQAVVSVSALPNVFVTTSQALFAELPSEPAIKTTHIVIHDQSAIDAAVLKNPQTPLTPSPTPRTPLSAGADRKFKYNWDSSVYDAVLPVRCRNIKGELHKNRFGSGGRGRCIKIDDNWYTPSEFEQLCGRGNSKDWKRSIRYAGRTLQCLIEEGIVQPHATSCTCSACCDNTMVSGPVRLFTPYKRRKREERRSQIQDPVRTVGGDSSVNDSLVVTLAPTVSPATESLQVATIPNLVDAPADEIMTPSVSAPQTPQTPRSAPTALDFTEQRQWWQLEEMVKNVVRQMQEIQKQVETVKSQSAAAREAALQQLRLQMENEKKEALNTSRIEAQMNLSRAILEAKAEKERDIQHALQQARIEVEEKLEVMVTVNKGDRVKHCANCNREAYSECTGCHQVSYCSTFCQRKDWCSHQEECVLVEDDGTESITD